MRNRKHGLSGTRVYQAWSNMKSRCYNPACAKFEYYGGRGITVCDRWRNDVEAFYVDMGEPEEGMTLDRIDTNKNYEPGNCRWVPQAIQNRNTRRNITIEFQGRSQCISEWARETGLNKTRIRIRLRNGWSIEEALTEPPWKW